MMRSLPGVLVIIILTFNRILKTQCLKVLLVLGAQALPQPQEVEQVEVVNGIPVEEAGQERSYRGVLSDYDYRQWTVGKVEMEVARIMKMMRTVYDQIGWVPKDKVNFDNTLKPLIDLDGELHWQSGVVTVSI